MNALLGDHAYASVEESPVELRILYGAQAGSRLCLSVGEYALGSDDSCTLILEGSDIEERHAILRFDGESAWIEPVDGAVRNAHGDDIDDELELTFGLPVELGAIWISVDREDAPWPDLKSVMPIGARDHAEREESPTQHAGEGMEVEENGETAVAVDSVFTAPSKPKWRRRHILLGVLLVLASGIGIFSLLQAHQAKPVIDVAAPPAEVVQAPPPQSVLEMIKDFPHARLTREHEQGHDRWVISGYVARAEQERELSSMLASTAPTVLVRVVVEEVLVQGARQILAGDTAAAYVRVESADNGVLKLIGAASSATAIQRIEANLRDGVTGVTDVKSQILLPEQLGRVLRDRIAAASLGDRLAISSEAPEMNLSGRLTMEEIRRWEDVLLAFNRDYGNVLPIRATVTRLIPKPPVGVQAIVGGAVPYIVTQAGEHVNQGGDVNGHTLVSVKDGEVVFEGRQRVRIAR